MENDLYFYCTCGYEFVTAPSAFCCQSRHPVAFHCPDCGSGAFINRADCTTERRAPVGTKTDAGCLGIGESYGGERCSVCDGTGIATTAPLRRCDACQGRGQVYVSDDHNGIEICAICDGAGQIPYPTTPTHDSGATVNEPDPYDTESRIYEEMKVVRQENERLVKERDEERAAHEVSKGVVARMSKEHVDWRVSRDRMRAEIADLVKERDNWVESCGRAEERIAETEHQRDAALAEVERLTKQRDATGLAWDEAENAVANLRARTAALEAVIEAQGEQAVAMSRNFHATLKAQEALNAVGLDAKVTLTSNCIEETP